MAESEAIQTAIMHVDILAATVAVIALKEADTEPTSGASTTNAEEVHRPGHGRPALRQPSFDWKAPDKYVELLNFEIEITNKLKIRTI